jgi:hypothetical protein
MSNLVNDGMPENNKFSLWNGLNAVFASIRDQQFSARRLRLAERLEAFERSRCHAYMFYAVSVEVEGETLHLFYASDFKIARSEAMKRIVWRLKSRYHPFQWVVAVVYLRNCYVQGDLRTTAILNGLRRRIPPSTSLLIHEQKTPN